MFNFILNYVCFVFQVLFFKQYNGKVYSFSKVFTQGFYLSIFSKYFSQIFIEVVVNVIHLTKSSHRLYFNKAFTLVFFTYS